MANKEQLKLINDTLKQFIELLNLSEDKLTELLKKYDTTQKKLEDIIVDIFKKYSSTNAEEFYKELKKFDRMKKLDNEVSTVINSLATEEVVLITGILAEAVKQSYYRNIFALEKNIKFNIKFDLLRKEIVDNIINLPIEGLNFSERLYANQFKLKQNVKSVLVDGMIKGHDIRQMTKNLTEKMDISRNNAKRIIRTETTRVWYQGQKEAFQNTGVEKVILIATLDGKTSSICRERDGNVYKLGEEPELPFHPNERSTYGADIENIQNSVRIDNETKKLIPYTTYEEWYKNKVT